MAKKYVITKVYANQPQEFVKSATLDSVEWTSTATEVSVYDTLVQATDAKNLVYSQVDGNTASHIRIVQVDEEALKAFND